MEDWVGLGWLVGYISKWASGTGNWTQSGGKFVISKIFLIMSKEERLPFRPLFRIHHREYVYLDEWVTVTWRVLECSLLTWMKYCWSRHVATPPGVRRVRSPWWLHDRNPSVIAVGLPWRGRRRPRCGDGQPTSHDLTESQNSSTMRWSHQLPTTTSSVWWICMHQMNMLEYEYEYEYASKEHKYKPTLVKVTIRAALPFEAAPLANLVYSLYLLTSGMPRHSQHFVRSWKLIYFGNLTPTLCYN